VENSIWHGISPKNGNGIIKISIVRQSEMICCVVEDNGIGIKKEIVEQKEKEEKKDKPSGIAITRTRISLMNRTQNTNASLQIYPLNAGTRVEINLPLELNF
jgi:sensor histidine kinase YesM